VLITTMTQPATLHRRACAPWAQEAYVTPIPAVSTAGVVGFVKGTGLPTAPAAMALLAAAPSTVRMTDQTPADATGAGTLGNQARSRPPV
jgi:hypothetical protein